MSETRLVRTCSACPEQYDLLVGDTKIAYFRLRGGLFTVAVPWVAGIEVYVKHWPDDPFKGEFDTDRERFNELRAGLRAVSRYMRHQIEEIVSSVTPGSVVETPGRGDGEGQDPGSGYVLRWPHD